MICTNVSLCSINAPCPVAPTWPKACKKEEKEDTMNYNEIEASRKYLNSRIFDAAYEKRDALVVQFNLNKPNGPNNYKQLIDAIKNGEYTLDTKCTAQIDSAIADGDYYGAPFDGIKWTFPGQPDRIGYSAAEKALEKARTTAKDIINTGDSAAGLAALQAFEAWTTAVTASPAPTA